MIPMKKLEEIITREKNFLNAAGILIATRMFDALSTSIIITERFNSAVDLDAIDIMALVKMSGPTAEVSVILNKFVATYESNPAARGFIEHYGLHQGLFLHNLAVTIPTLLVAYFLNKIPNPFKLGNTVLYAISGISAIVEFNNFYQ